MALLENIVKKISSPFDRAKAYYTILFTVNSIPFSPIELDMIAFTAVNGTLSSPPLRDEFLSTFKISRNYFNMTLPKLRKRGIMVKGDDKKMRLSPILQRDFSGHILLHLNILKDEDTQ